MRHKFSWTHWKHPGIELMLIVDAKNRTEAEEKMEDFIPTLLPRDDWWAQHWTRKCKKECK